MLVIATRAEREYKGRWLFHCPACGTRNNQNPRQYEEDLISGRVMICHKCHREVRVDAPHTMKGIIVCS